MMGKNLAVVTFVASVFCVALPSLAADNDDSAELAKALPEASVSLGQGLKASAREGKPISGKFEMHEGALQLSVYTMKGKKFSEVIVDHKTGSIKKAETITDADDLKHAREQSRAMAKTKSSLAKVVQSAVKANGGFRAVGAMPMLKAGQPVVEVALMNGAKVKKVTKKLQ